MLGLWSVARRRAAGRDREGGGGKMADVSPLPPPAPARELSELSSTTLQMTPLFRYPEGRVYFLVS